MSAWNGESQVSWITVSYDGTRDVWMAKCEGETREYPLERCASETTAARKALRGVYASEGLRVKIDRMESHKHYGKDMWDFKAYYHVR